jgi:hypothetical protein
VKRGLEQLSLIEPEADGDTRATVIALTEGGQARDRSILWRHIWTDRRPARRMLRVCGMVAAMSLAVVAISACAHPSVRASFPTRWDVVMRAMREVDPSLRLTPGPGTITASWPGKLQLDSFGVVVVEIRALSEFPRSSTPEAAEDLDTESGSWLTEPVYVVPGLVELTLKPLPGLTVESDSDGGSPIVNTVTVERGKVVQAAWSVRATRPGGSGVVLSAPRVAVANPEERVTAKQLGMMDINDMRLTLTLDIEATTIAPRPTTQSAPSPTTQSSLKDVDSTTPLEFVAQILVIVGAFVTVLPFVLWLIAQELDKRGRAPRLAAIIGWLPRRLLEFRSHDTSAGSSTNRKSD